MAMQYNFGNRKGGSSVLYNRGGGSAMRGTKGNPLLSTYTKPNQDDLYN